MRGVHAEQHSTCRRSTWRHSTCVRNKHTHHRYTTHVHSTTLHTPHVHNKHPHQPTHTHNHLPLHTPFQVWEVAGQLTGLACSVAVLRALQPLDSAQAVLAVWLAVHSVHVVLRWQALSSLTFPYPNQKRLAALVCSHVQHGTVPGSPLGGGVCRGLCACLITLHT